MKHLLNWNEIDHHVWENCLDSALRFKRDGKTWSSVASDKSLGMIFFNPSLRTRASMELAAAQLGAHSTTITPGQGTWGFAFDDGMRMDGPEAEHIQEAVGVLSRYFDALGVRLFASMTDADQDRKELLLTRFVSAATVPVINLESASWHPCQELADAATLMERFDGKPEGKRFVLAWTHHPKALPMAVPNSALMAASRLGMDITLVRPDSHPLDPNVMELAKSVAADVSESGDMDAGLAGADIVYAKAWGGPMVYSNPETEEQIRRGLKDWKVTARRMSTTNSAAFMHCLPVRRNVVVDDAVLDGPDAIHLDQAEFRLHAQKAILEHVWDLSAKMTSRPTAEVGSWA